MKGIQLTILRELDIDAMSERDTYVPINRREEIVRYIEQGAMPQKLWRMLLITDHNKIAFMPNMMPHDSVTTMIRWLRFYAPAACWGSVDRVLDWMDAQRGRTSSKMLGAKP